MVNYLSVCGLKRTIHLTQCTATRIIQMRQIHLLARAAQSYFKCALSFHALYQKKAAAAVSRQKHDLHEYSCINYLKNVFQRNASL